MFVRFNEDIRQLLESIGYDFIRVEPSKYLKGYEIIPHFEKDKELHFPEETIAVGLCSDLSKWLASEVLPNAYLIDNAYVPG